MRIKRAKLPVNYKSSKEINKMFDITKFKFDVPEVEMTIDKVTDMAVQTIDYQKAVFSETLKYFNEITGKMFYTYTVSAAESVNNATEYAKENISNSKKKVANLFGNSK